MQGEEEKSFESSYWYILVENGYWCELFIKVI